MSKVFKNIAIFSLWFAGLVIMAHLAIPHDHHSDCSVFSKENECHADNAKLPVKSPVFPIHCHALNDLTVEKASVIYIVHNDLSTCDLFTVSSFNLAISALDLPGIKIKDFPEPLLETDFLRLSSLRAPPSFV